MQQLWMAVLQHCFYNCFLKFVNTLNYKMAIKHRKYNITGKEELKKAFTEECKKQPRNLKDSRLTIKTKLT